MHDRELSLALEKGVLRFVSGLDVEKERKVK